MTGKLSLLLLLFLFMLGRHSSAQAETLATIYFYNPEINTNSNLALKQNFDRFLKDYGDFSFQPVSNINTFDALIHSNNQALFMMSSQHFDTLKAQTSLQKKFVGSKNNSTTYQKLLVSSLNSNSYKQLQNMTVAVSDTKENATRYLNEIFANKTPNFIQHIQILIVPKDIDALMAISYGIAQSALCTDLSFDALRKLDSQQYSYLNILGKSKSRQRLVLASHKNNHNEPVKQLLNAVIAMPKSLRGRIQLGMLGLDNWKKVPMTLPHKAVASSKTIGAENE